MKKKEIVGVKCRILKGGMFSKEKIVDVCGRGYFVWDCNLKFSNEDPKLPYVQAICAYYDRLKRNYLVGINANDGYENVRAKESQLVFA